MSSHQVQSAVLPAILASSTVFSLLTFPFFFHRSQPATGSFLINPRLQVILESQNRDLTIRYIGGALVISVATGITTVELWRRQKARQATIAAKQKVKDTASVGLPPPSLHHPDEWIDRDQSSSDWETIDQLFEGMGSPEFEQPSEPAFAALTTDQLTQVAKETDETGTGGTLPPIQTVSSAEANPQPGQVMELTGEYTTCRIRVSSMQRRQFAIQVAGQYYGFFRLLPTKEAALETADFLSRRQHHVMVTPVEQQYAVWVWQPEAELELLTQ